MATPMTTPMTTPVTTTEKAPRPHVTIKEFALQFFESFSRNQPFDLAAQLAYYALLSLFPFVMFVLTVIGYLPLHGLDRQVMDSIYDVMPPEAARLCDQTIHEVIGKQRGWLLAVTLIFALWTASGGASGLITALNRAYDVAETRKSWKVRARALLVTLTGVVAIIVATTAMLVGPSLVHHIWEFFGLGGAFDRIWALLRWPVAAFTMTIMLALVYYFLPNVKQRFHLITPGSIVAVLAWIGASVGFRLYVGHFSSYTRTYGALGTVVVLLVWLYLSGLMVILGGEINAIVDRVHRGILHTEKEEGAARVHDPRPVGPDGDDNRPRPPRRSVKPA
jgi:membrane protein